MTFILFILIFSVVVISHEFGHYLLGRTNGIKVVEFMVGMGPKIVSWKKKDTLYSIRLLPLGGACVFKGEDGMQQEEGESTEGSFAQANVWSRIATVLAGPIFNFILGAIIALIMVNLIVIRTPQLSDVSEDGPAAMAGLQPGDVILSLNGEKIYLADDIVLFNRVNGGEDVVVKYRRGDEIRETVVKPVYNGQDSYILGVYLGTVLEEKGIDRLPYAWYEIRLSMKQTWKSLGMLVKGRVKRDEVAGPVGIAVNVVGKTYNQAKVYGWQTILVNMLNITMLLSINLGILNLLPLPALDGGRLFFMLIELIRGKPVPPEKEGMVHFIGLMFFMGLMVFVFYNDLRNIFHF